MDASKITELRQKQNTVYLRRSNTVDSSTMTWRNQIQSSKYIKGMATCSELENIDVPTEPVCNQLILATGVDTGPTGYLRPMGDTGATGDTGPSEPSGPSGTIEPVTTCFQPYPRKGAAGSASTVYSSDKILLRRAGRQYCAELITDQDAYTILPNCAPVNTNGPTRNNPNPPINNQDTNPYLPPFDTYYKFKNPPAPVIDQNKKHYVQYCNGCVTEATITRYGWPLWMVGMPNSLIISNSVTYNGDSVFVTGTFTGTIHLYDGIPTQPPIAGPPTIIMKSISTNLDTFLITYDETGKIQWFTTMQTITGRQTTGYSIVVDSSGIYMSGYTDGTVNFYNALSRDNYAQYGPTMSSVSTESSALFVLKYSLSGNLEWVTLVDHIETQSVPAQVSEIQPISMSQLCTDGKNVYVCNYFNTSATVYSSNGIQPLTMDNSILLTSMSNSTQAFLVQYNAFTGRTNWATRLLGDDITMNGTTRATGLVCDTHNVYMSGFFNNTATCYDAVSPSAPTFAAPSAYRYKISNGDENGMFIMSYNKTGIVQWINQGNISNSIFIPSGVRLTIDASGIYVVVPFPNIISFNTTPGGGSFIQLINPGSNTYNVGIVKYTLDGTLVWVNKILNVDVEIGSLNINTNGFSLSSDGSALYVTGGFGPNSIGLYNSSTIGDPTPQAATLSTAGGTDTSVFLIKYNLLGGLQWSTIIGRPNSYAYGYSVSTNTNLIYLTGTLNGPVDIYHSNGLSQPNRIATSLIPNPSTYFYSYIIKYDQAGQVLFR